MEPKSTDEMIREMYEWFLSMKDKVEEMEPMLESLSKSPMGKMLGIKL